MSRAIVIDDNTSVHNGHYNELSSLLLSAAAEMGYQPVLVAHKDFKGNPSLPEHCEILRRFTTRRMTRWSCGYDGKSTIARDIEAKPLSRSMMARVSATRDEWLTRSQWRPSEMIRRWSIGLNEAIHSLNPTANDELIFQTADDFMMVAMARALTAVRSRRLRIKAIFHYAVFGADDSPSNSRLAFDQQLNGALARLQHHDVRLFATTNLLADQINSGSLSQPVHPIPYPIRTPSPTNEIRAIQSIPRLMLGGVHRPEQGREAVAPFLDSVYEPFVQNGRCTLTLRLDPKHWQRVVPKSLHTYFLPAVERQFPPISAGENPSDESLPALDVQPMTLSEADYYQMLSSADLGVLLYDAARYQVRCSGILLEFLTRGIPVIVPDDSWLATTVRHFSTNHPVGYAYRDVREIPSLIERFLANRETIQRAALNTAIDVSAAHSPLTTFRSLLDQNSFAQVTTKDLYAA
jgi:hypothetical protein